MKIMLAPMEGVLDFALREILTEQAAYDYAVTEFVRINQHVISENVFYRYCPELYNGGLTRSGTPVYVQLLGQNGSVMAESALIAVGLGAKGIDINFGCPAKTVNYNRGGSVLLKEPYTVHNIVKVVREAVPSEIPVTAKMRLGYEDKSLAIQNAIAIEEAGADRLTVHARTKVEGYKPPAHWHWIAKINENVSMPVIANGEIWSKQDAIQCMEESGCKDIMIGRGGLALPNLANVIKHGEQPTPWFSMCEILLKYSEYEREEKKSRYLCNRIKQWFRYLMHEYDQAEGLFEKIKKHRELEELVEEINIHSASLV